jgi:hypothetical protein
LGRYTHAASSTPADPEAQRRLEEGRERARVQRERVQTEEKARRESEQAARLQPLLDEYRRRNSRACALDAKWNELTPEERAEFREHYDWLRDHQHPNLSVA